MADDNLAETVGGKFTQPTKVMSVNSGKVTFRCLTKPNGTGGVKRLQGQWLILERIPAANANWLADTGRESLNTRMK
jgi:hypothetical protein